VCFLRNLVKSPSFKIWNVYIRAIFIILILLLQLFYTQPYATSFNAKVLYWENDYSIVQYPLSNRSSVPIAIAISHDGIVWFLEQASNKLVSFDPGNYTFKEYNIPTANSFPISLAVDSYGGVWFTELNGEKIGYLHSGNRDIVEYKIPEINVSLQGLRQQIPCGPSAIKIDPNRNVWVACLFSNQIDEFIPTTKTFLTYNLPVFQSGPADLLFASDKLWFSAADANMLGFADLSAIAPNTSSGIAEFPPLNLTYLYTFSHPTSFLGKEENITTSLPTPTSITLGNDGETLWITEHIDNSFDSYNLMSKTLNKFWLSKTNNLFGYTYAFPNYIQQDSEGNLWIAEHYGNKIAVFSPSNMTLLELEIPCCKTDIAGAYTGALDQQGNFWFVETNGGAIGEVVMHSNSTALYASLPQTYLNIRAGNSLTLPIVYKLSSGAPMNLTFDVSGITPDGKLENLTAAFTPSVLSLSEGANETVMLKLTDFGLMQGRYFLTVSAYSPGAIYSFILGIKAESKLTFSLYEAITIALSLTLLMITATYLVMRYRRKG
jgi:streptogramin lyase